MNNDWLNSADKVEPFLTEKKGDKNGWRGFHKREYNRVVLNTAINTSDLQLTAFYIRLKAHDAYRT